MGEIGGFPERGLGFERDWTKGNIFRNLLSLAWPIVVHEGFWVVGMTVDMIWVGKLGATSIAGVGIAFTVSMVAESAMMGLIVGMTAMVTRFVGAGDARGANHVARQAFVISAAYGAVMTAVGLFLAQPILGLFGLEADVVAEGAAYMRIMFAGSMATSFCFMAYTIMRASGDTVTPMRISIFVRCIHVLLAPFLIFGWWMFPRMGVSGAALSNVVAQILGTALGLWVLFSGRTRLRLTLRGFRLDLNIIWRIVRIGIWASVMGVQRNLSQIMMIWFMAPFGTLAVAAHSLSQRVMMILIVPCWALGVGAGVLVGQNLGARQPERAQRTGWLAAGLAEALLFVASVAILLRAEDIIRIFNAEPELVTEASTFLRIAVAGFLLMGIMVILQQAISGAGDTLPAMIFSVISVWAVQLPLAYFLPQVTDLGVYGIRWAMVAGIVSGAVAFLIYFRTGRWKRKRV